MKVVRTLTALSLGLAILGAGVTVSAVPKTKADHSALAEKYDKMAMDQDAIVKEHTEMKKDYRSNQAMLPKAYAISARGSQFTACQRKGPRRSRCCQKKIKVAPRTMSETMMDFSVSWSISSCGTPSAGARNIMRANSAAVPLPAVSAGSAFAAGTAG